MSIRSICHAVKHRQGELIVLIDDDKQVILTRAATKHRLSAGDDLLSGVESASGMR